MTGELGDPRAKAERRGVPVRTQAAPDRALDAPHDLPGELGVGVDEHEHELIAAHPSAMVGGSDARGEPLSQRLEDPIADRVPTEVVDLLEEVDVEDDQSHWVAPPLGAEPAPRRASPRSARRLSRSVSGSSQRLAFEFVIARSDPAERVHEGFVCPSPSPRSILGEAESAEKMGLAAHAGASCRSPRPTPRALPSALC